MIILGLMPRPCLDVAQPGCVQAVKMRQISFSIACVSSEADLTFCHGRLWLMTWHVIVPAARMAYVVV